MSLLGGSEAGRRSSGVATKGADAAEGGVGRRERQGLARLARPAACVLRRVGGPVGGRSPHVSGLVGWPSAGADF